MYINIYTVFLFTLYKCSCVFFLGSQDDFLNIYYMQNRGGILLDLKCLLTYGFLFHTYKFDVFTGRNVL